MRREHSGSLDDILLESEGERRVSLGGSGEQMTSEEQKGAEKASAPVDTTFSKAKESVIEKSAT